MKHCQFGLGHQSDLQGVRKGNFARLGKIRRMKNGLYLDFFNQVRVTHNLLNDGIQLGEYGIKLRSTYRYIALAEVPAPT
jgi:hypothetical protein